uniref:Uncharacterized protein n=1 Tax=Pyrodinium bahamense TaxID=73915 RepID=A0A7S0ALV0_9DINO
MDVGAAQSPGLDARLGSLCELVQRQQVRLDVLADEVHSLRECLQEAGAVTAQAILARQHRLRFARACLQYPCAWGSCVETVVAMRERVLALAELLGKRCVSALAASSRGLSRVVGSMSGELAATLPPMIYVIGGEDDDGRTLAEVEGLCPSTGVWEPCPPLPTPRKWCAAAGVAGHVYVLGGWGADDDTLDLVSRFNPWLAAWAEMPAMLQRRGAPAAVATGTQLWAVGGQDGELVHDSAEVLDLSAGMWASAPAMQSPRQAAGALQLYGRIYAIGGHGANREALGQVECFDLQACAWIEMPSLRTPRAGLAAAAVGGRAYALGGCDAAGRELCSLERLNPQVGVWEAMPPMAVPRWGLGAASCGGRLFALGGTDRMEGSSIGACERFWPERADSPTVLRGGAGSWSFIGCLRLPRRLFGAASSR